MKKHLIWASTGMLAIGTIVVVSCSKDEGMDDYYNLDVEFRTPLTRTAQNDFETGSTQSFGGANTNPYEIPQNENECMLYAIIKIAVTNHIPITVIDSDGTSKTKRIGVGGYTATNAYDYVKGLATSQSWPTCDVNGNIIEGADPFNYEGGAMSPSVAKTIAQKSGIMKGEILYFNSYDDMQRTINTDAFKKEHSNGTYIINSNIGEHATIGYGVDKNGNIKYSDATKSKTTYKDSEKTGSWTIIY